ncbi:TetR/AcrR family transcriptional regulator [Stutzerimonas azotifigens]|uniref:TetR/AcrR family transcriptional regulator n=1 Tax=Stutzerimonas azotifigens TaxID=291995 RepID=A0ABR5Z5C7_9GAMM|nr:TetR/AcrR family transcriptional regulator [Stutzerimonas azotifigens]MBA1275358.1 TetR/AcrR family transcriptional regulator [Stutzerimonas azotifigens]
MSKTAPPQASGKAPAQAKKRTRLTPDVRRQQILDAALAEFSAVGFQGATVEKIAQRVGLTKAGLYAHFKSKDAIFDELLASRMFSPSLPSHWQWSEGASLDETVDRYLDTVYSFVRNPQTQAIFRLLISESGRSPERVRHWHEQLFQPHASRRQGELDECVAKGVVPENVISRKFALASAPALLAMVTQLLVGGQAAEDEVAEIREAHRMMLLTLFTPKGA